jgi:hypothetical protein
MPAILKPMNQLVSQNQPKGLGIDIIQMLAARRNEVFHTWDFDPTGWRHVNEEMCALEHSIVASKLSSAFDDIGMPQHALSPRASHHKYMKTDREEQFTQRALTPMGYCLALRAAKRVQ